jgi:RNA-binding protein
MIAPGATSRSAASSSSILNAARDRSPASLARRTYGSEKCSASHRPLDLLRRATETLRCTSLYNATMTLTERQKKHLRKLGHELHPIVLVGQRGLNPGVVAELKLALEHHELVKLRVRVGDRESRDAILAELAKLTESEFVYRIGNVGLFYKKNIELAKILLPDS